MECGLNCRCNEQYRLLIDINIPSIQRNCIHIMTVVSFKLASPHFDTLIGYITAQTKRKKRFMQTQVTHKNVRAKGTKRLLTYLAYSQRWPGPPNLRLVWGDSLSALSSTVLRTGALWQGMGLIRSTWPCRKLPNWDWTRQAVVTTKYCCISVSWNVNTVWVYNYIWYSI